MVDHLAQSLCVLETKYVRSILKSPLYEFSLMDSTLLEEVTNLQNSIFEIRETKP
jgi:hypothetical protein